MMNSDTSYLASNTDNDEDQDNLNDLNNLINSNSNNQDSTQSNNSINLNDIANLFSSAKNDLNQSKQGGVTKEQLDALNKHEGVNTWTSLFMNLVGGLGHVDAKPYEEPLNRSVEQQRNNLLLQNQFAQQQAQKASQEQQFGLGQLRAGQEIQQQKIAQAPASNIKIATLMSYFNQAHVPFDINDYKDMTNAQADQAINDVQKLAANQTSLDRYNQLAKLRTDIPTTDQQGNKYIYNKQTKELTPIFGNNSPQDENQSLNYHQVTNYSPNSAKLLQKLSNEYQKSYGNNDSDFNATLDRVDSVLQDAEKGNFVAARSLPAQEARIFDDIGKGRLSNYDIQLQKDPATRGLLTSLQGSLFGLAGQGNITPDDAKNIRQVITTLREAHNRNIENVKNRFNTQATAIVGRPFKDDAYMFGSVSTPQDINTNSESTQQSIPPVGKVMPTPYSSLDDYKKSLQGGGQ